MQLLQPYVFTERFFSLLPDHIQKTFPSHSSRESFYFLKLVGGGEWRLKPKQMIQVKKNQNKSTEASYTMLRFPSLQNVHIPCFSQQLFVWNIIKGNRLQDFVFLYLNINLSHLEDLSNYYSIMYNLWNSLSLCCWHGLILKVCLNAVHTGEFYSGVWDTLLTVQELSLI